MQQYVLTHAYLNNPKKDGFTIKTSLSLTDLIERINFLEYLTWEVYRDFSIEQRQKLIAQNKADESIFFQHDTLKNPIIQEILNYLHIFIVGRKPTKKIQKIIDLYVIWELNIAKLNLDVVTVKEKQYLIELIKRYYLS